MRWNIGPVGVKDLFTLINLAGGIAAINFILDQRFDLAGYALLAGYMVGDVLDGPVARLTKTSNKFGSELDTATDHFTQAVVPGILVFAVYAHAGHRALGVALMGILVACATIRQALFSVAKMGDPLTYCGLPRTVSGYAAMAFVLSRFGFRDNPAGVAIGCALIPALSLAGLAPIPYMTHRGARRMQTHVKMLVIAFLVTPTLAFFLARDFTFDVLLLWTIGYAATAWIPIYPHEKQAFYARYRQWLVEVSEK